MKVKHLIVLLLALFSFYSCGKKEESTSASMISGADSKIWKATKETNASGDKEKLDRDEKKQELQFYSNGTFAINAEPANQTGKWTYDQASKTLSLNFEGENKTENFQVEDLDDDKMKLKAADGSEMTLEAE